MSDVESNLNPLPPIPASGRLLAIDFGAVRMGLAICDARRTIASPLATYVRRGDPADADYFRQLIRDEQIVGAVIGLPIHTSGKESVQSAEARRFAHWFHRETGCPFCLFDERYSSSAADALIAGQLTRRQRKMRRDKIAAHVILSAYLESRGGRWDRPLDD